jgi:hypothetical protein
MAVSFHSAPLKVWCGSDGFNAPQRGVLSPAEARVALGFFAEGFELGGIFLFRQRRNRQREDPQIPGKPAAKNALPVPAGWGLTLKPA